MPTEPLPLHEAIAAAISGRYSQTELGDLLGVGQSNVSKWMRGVTRPSLDDLVRIEDACRRPRGFILQAAGYVDCPAERTVLDSLARDPELTESGREIVCAAYEAARAFYRRRRQPQQVAGD